MGQLPPPRTSPEAHCPHSQYPLLSRTCWPPVLHDLQAWVMVNAGWMTGADELKVVRIPARTCYPIRPIGHKLLRLSQRLGLQEE
eukprot:2982580-Rhodomonas_salina.2